MNEEEFMMAVQRSNAVLLDQLNKILISKQRVKDAIDDMSCYHAPSVCQCCMNLEELKKELGLE